MYACKVQVVCPHCNKPTRVGHKLYEDGTKGAHLQEVRRVAVREERRMARLKDYYKQEVAPALMKKFSQRADPGGMGPERG